MITWGERLDLAVDEFNVWKDVYGAELPTGLAMDKALKRAGFRDVIKENSDLKKSVSTWIEALESCLPDPEEGYDKDTEAVLKYVISSMCDKVKAQ